MNETEVIANLLLLIVVADVVYLAVATIRHRMRNMKEPWNDVKLPLDMRHHALVIIVGLIGVGLLLKAQASVVIRMNGLEVDFLFRINFSLRINDSSRVYHIGSPNEAISSASATS